MSNVLKVLGNEITLDSVGANTTLSTVSGSVLVRLFNTSNSTLVTVTQQTSANANVASFSMGYLGTDESVIYMRKETSDKLIVSANSVVKAVPFGYY